MEYQDIYNKLDSFAALTLSQQLPTAVGQSGAMFARGAGDYIRQMFSTVGSTYTAMVGLADADARIRAAAISADAVKKSAALSAKSRMYSTDVSAASQATAINEQAREFNAQLDLQKQALNLVKEIHNQAKAIQSLAYSLANMDYDSTLNGSYGGEYD